MRTLTITLIILSAANLMGQPETSDYQALEQELIEEYVDHFSFSILILFDNEITYKKVNDPEGEGDENLLFNIASITKAVTAAGIMKLVDRDLVRLTDPVGSYFPEAPADKKEITLHQLLSHQSGFSQTYPCEGVTESSEALRAIMKEDLAFEPGTSFRYSNQNYQLLALLIERITGMDFNTFIRKEIFTPLDMHHTVFWDEINDNSPVAEMSKKIRRSTGKKDWGWIGATGIFSTSTDLLKFWNGVNGQDLMSSTSRAQLFEAHYSTSSGLGIGYGFYLSETTKWGTPEIWTRGTESWGHNAVIRVFPEKQVVIVVLTDSGEMGKNKMTGNKIISDMLADYILGEK